MLSHPLRTLIGLGGALVFLLPTPAEAQIVRRFRGGGIQVQAPLVRVNVNPYGGTSVRAPLVAIDPGGVRIGLGRRRAPIPQQLGPQQLGPQQPGLQQPGLRQAAPPVRRPTAADPRTQVPSGDLSDRGYIPFPTAEELAAMDDETLFTAVNDLGYSLDVRLARLKTGAGWQRYLQIPESALRNPAASFEQFKQTLARYDSVADNPEFAKIAGLPSFIATKAALRQVVARLAEPQAATPSNADAAGPAFPPAVEEVLPTPAVPAEPEATRGEHSILKPTLSN